MYPAPVLFGTIGLYDILLVVAILTCLISADRMGILRGFSVKLQKVLIIAFMVAIIMGLFGTVFFQALYNIPERGGFIIDKDTGMTFYGGFIFGVGFFLVVWFGLGKLWCKNDEPKKQFGTIADMAACLIPFAHGLGRIGCLTAGCCHGGLTDKWYGIMHYGLTTGGELIPIGKMVPVQLFEALFLFALSFVLCYLFFVKFGRENKGRFPLLPVYAIGYGVWRFCIEFARADERGETIISALSPSQLIAVIMVVAAVGYLCVWHFYKKRKIKIEEDRKE